MKKIIPIFVLSLLFTDFLIAAQPKRLIIDSAHEFAKGEALSVTISEPGQLVAGPQANLLLDLDDRMIWSAIIDQKTEDFILGTGPKGELLRVTRSGKMEKITEFKESDIYAVAQSVKGEIYVGTSPHGKVFKILPNGKVDEFFDPKENYIWDLAIDQDGNLFVGTGKKGKIYRVSPEGKGEVFYDSDEAHIKELVFEPAGTLLAGSSGSGLLYRISGKDKGIVLLDAPKEEISAICVQESGIIYVAASGAGHPIQTITNTSGKTTTSSKNKQNKKNAKGSSLSNLTNAKSYLYQIKKNLFPDMIWGSRDIIYSLLPHPKGVMIGTGANGVLYHMDQEENLTQIAQFDSFDLTVLLQKNEESIGVLTSNLGQAYLLETQGTKQGVYQSKVIDSKLFADWGRLKVSGKGKWSVKTRSGNTSDPDKSWYPWRFSQGEKVLNPSARYFQFELGLESGAEVERVEFSYLPQNQPPVIKSVRVLEPGIGYEAIGNISQPNQPKTSDQLFKNQTTTTFSSKTRFRSVSKTGLRTVAWACTDKNSDALSYTVEIRKETSDSWDVLAEDVTQNVLTWDTNGWEDGTYYVRVTASDHLSNFEGKELKSSRVSEAWYIDHTPPKVRVTRQGSSFVAVEISDLSSSIQAASFSEDGQNYQLMQPDDGILDSTIESFEVSRNPEKPLYIRAEDGNGNIGGLRVPPVRK